MADGASAALVGRQWARYEGGELCFFYQSRVNCLLHPRGTRGIGRGASFLNGPIQVISGSMSENENIRTKWILLWNRHFRYAPSCLDIRSHEVAAESGRRIGPLTARREGEHCSRMTPPDTLGVTIPIVQAPMAGVSMPELAAAVSNAGGLGSIGIGATDATGARTMIEATRAQTDRPFNVNLFVHTRANANPVREQAWLDALRPLFERFGSCLLYTSPSPRD